MKSCRECMQQVRTMQLMVDRIVIITKNSLLAAVLSALCIGCSEKSSDDRTSVGTQMVGIPMGWFSMGKDREDGEADEEPVHRVWLEGFCIGKYEVTNEEYTRFVEKTGYKPQGPCLKYAGKGREKHPVVAVTWADANAYACWAGGRLPTEAEWEKAARGGEFGNPYPWPWPETPLWASDIVDFKGRVCCRENRGTGVPPTYPVGSFQPNKLGLYDTVGNVYEWCNDWYDENYYKNAKSRNPKGPATGKRKVFRGGAWTSTNWSMRAAYRGRANPDYWSLDIGFRIAKSVRTATIP